MPVYDQIRETLFWHFESYDRRRKFVEKIYTSDVIFQESRADWNWARRGGEIYYNETPEPSVYHPTFFSHFLLAFLINSKLLRSS